MGEAIIGALAALMVGIPATVIPVWRMLQTAKKDAAKEYKSIFDRQEKRIHRLEEAADQHQQAVAALISDHSQCREMLAGMYSELVSVYDTACRHRNALTELGHDPGEVPPLRSQPHISMEGVFLARQAQQSSRLAVEVTRREGSVNEDPSGR